MNQKLTSAVLIVLSASMDAHPDDALAHVAGDLESHGLEESHRAPGHGDSSICDYIQWFSDGEDSRYESN